MPYRTSPYAGPCIVCDTLTPAVCRRCGKPICADHSTEIDFYVPTVQCSDEAHCEPRPRRYTRRKLIEPKPMFELGAPFSEFYGL
jgi:hypothetical protein